MQWYMKAMRQYADFNGRARRSEYWMFTLFFLIVYVVAVILDLLVGTIQNTGTPILALLVALAHIVPSLAVTVRRLHDTDRSGWWYFISFVPFVGAIILIVFNATEGTRGPNQFGPDPKQVAGPPYGYPQPGVA